MPAEALRVSVDADARSLRAVRRALRTWLEALGAARIDDVVLAVDEAVANAVEHSGVVPGGDHAPAITVSATVVVDTIHIEVRDPGTWRPAAAEGDRGRGLVIMRALMDSVDVHCGVDSTAVVMRRRIG